MRIALRSYSRCPEDPESLRVVDMENICEPCASVCFTVAHRSIDMERKVNVKRSIFVRGIHGQMGALPFKGPELYGYTAIVYVTHCQCDAGHSVSFQVAEHRRLWPGTKLYCLATEAHDCKRNAQDCCPKDEPPCQRGSNYLCEFIISERDWRLPITLQPCLSYYHMYAISWFIFFSVVNCIHH